MLERHGIPRRMIPRERLRRYDTRSRFFTRVLHAPFTIVKSIRFAHRVPNAQDSFFRWMEIIPETFVIAKAKRITDRNEVIAIREKKVHWRKCPNAQRATELRNDSQRFDDTRANVLRIEIDMRIVQLREQERVKPLAVRRAANDPREVRFDVGQKREFHFVETRQLTIVGQSQPGMVEQERMQVLLADDGAHVIRHASQMAEQTRGPHFCRECPQISIVNGQLRAAINERELRPFALGIPGEESRTGKIQAIVKCRLVGLVDEGDVGLVEQILEQDPLAEIGKDATHGRVFRRLAGRAQELCDVRENLSARRDYFFGLMNRSVMRSLSPIAAYLALSFSPSSNVGGNVQTPSG